MWNDFNSDTMQQQIDALYQQVRALEYNNTNGILRTLSMAEKLSLQYKNNTELLILQTRLQIMNSQEQRARSIANQVWGIGGNISLMYEKMYLDDLINLGMLDMAAILIRPRFENPAENVKIFPLEMLRFALITGNVNLIKRVVASAPNNILFSAMNQFADTYLKTGYAAHFSNIAKIVLNNIGIAICGYDFNFYTDRGFTDVEIVLYFSNYDFNLNKYTMLINNKIDGYCLTSGVKRINNLSFVCKSIKDRTKI